VSVLAIVGPTASGKSELALAVATARTEQGAPTEIVAVDAFTIYRHMDIGTAKPSAAVQAQVPHHLLDVIDPSEALTVAQFQQLARTVVDEVIARGVTPLLVGGSGLYFRAVVDDLVFPPTDPAVRGALEKQWGSDPDAAHRVLADRDPEAAERIEPANIRRTIRALEVIELTGTTFSSFRAAWDSYTSVYDDLHIGSIHVDVDDLRARVSQRAQAMVEAGLIEEARQLRAAGSVSRTAMQAIGYAEAFAVLDGDAPVAELASAIAQRTWRYARRQRSWFAADPRCVPSSGPTIRSRLTSIEA
jgi:tRNA dimethylallyltransferase